MEAKYMRVTLQQDGATGKEFVVVESLEGDDLTHREERNWKRFPYQARDLAQALATLWWGSALTTIRRISETNCIAQAQDLEEAPELVIVT